MNNSSNLHNSPCFPVLQNQLNAFKPLGDGSGSTGIWFELHGRSCDGQRRKQSVAGSGGRGLMRQANYGTQERGNY